MQDARKRSRIWYRCSVCGEEWIQIGRHVKKTGHSDYAPIRWDDPHNHRSAHHLIVAVRGRAEKQTCVCGQPAANWALRAELHRFQEMAWSPDPWDYVAMCVRCHKHQDWPADAWRATALRARAVAGRNGGVRLRELRAEDPELDAKIRRTMSENGRQNASNPEHQAKMKEGLRRKREDPEFEARFIEAKRRAARISNERRKES